VPLPETARPLAAPLRAATRSRRVAVPQAGASAAGGVLLGLALVTMYFDAHLRFTEKNLLVSDALILLAALTTFRPQNIFRAISATSTTAPFLLFAVAALLSIVASSGTYRIDEAEALITVGQYAFSFLLLAPLVAVHAGELGGARRLWNIHGLMLALAGALSLTDHFGLTRFTPTFTPYGKENVLLGVGGFGFFSFASPYVLDRALREFPGPRYLLWTAAWIAGFAGTVMSGRRSPMVVVLALILPVVWLNLRRLRQNLRGIRAVAAAAPVAALAVFLFQSLPGISRRIERDQPEFAGRTRRRASESTIQARREQYDFVLEDFASRRQLLGTGPKQFVTLHPQFLAKVHNFYLEQLYETGLLGLAAFLAMVGAPLRWAIRAFRLASRRRSEQWRHHWFINCLSMAGVLCYGLFAPIAYTRFFWSFYFLASGHRRSLERLKAESEPLRWRVGARLASAG